MNANHLIINIGRQLGSGGRVIGKELADKLNMRFLDRELLNLAAQESGFDLKFFERSDEKKGFFKFLDNLRTSHFSTDLYDNQLSEESLFKIQSDAIRSAAEEGSCVIVGRCADYILRDYRGCVNIFITANKTDRIKRVCHYDGITPEEAKRKIESGDEKRAAYYNYYTGKTWGAAASYDLCINSSRLGIEATTQYIIDFVNRLRG
jgi:hypothetical protein